MDPREDKIDISLFDCVKEGIDIGCRITNNK